MINTFSMERGSGKTSEVIRKMEEDEGLFLLVPTERQKGLYPLHLQNRIGSGLKLLSGVLREKRIDRVILDEGFAYQKDDLAKLYYYLGQHGIKTDSYGTI